MEAPLLQAPICGRVAEEASVCIVLLLHITSL